MAKLLSGTILVALAIAVPITTMAGVDIYVGIPPIVFHAPPELVEIPETDVYVVPDLQEDIFLYDGWWWRLWEGRWYHSRHHSSGWVYYEGVPSFYPGIPSGWRDRYRDHHWRGHQRNYERIPHRWERGTYWENQQTWGVQKNSADWAAPKYLGIPIWRW